MLLCRSDNEHVDGQPNEDVWWPTCATFSPDGTTRTHTKIPPRNRGASGIRKLFHLHFELCVSAFFWAEAATVANIRMCDYLGIGLCLRFAPYKWIYMFAHWIQSTKSLCLVLPSTQRCRVFFSVFFCTDLWLEKTNVEMQSFARRKA